MLYNIKPISLQYNIKPISLQRVFHGIRFKVNEDWVSGIDTLLFYMPFPSVSPVSLPLLFAKKLS